MRGCAVEQHCNGVVLRFVLRAGNQVKKKCPCQVCYKELFSVPGDCHEMVLPPAIREQIMHKVMQCFFSSFKAIYEYFGYFSGTLFSAWRQ